jgi:hypothetical protein
MTLSWVGCQQELGGLIENGELSAAVRKLEAVERGRASDESENKLAEPLHAISALLV